MENSNAPQTPMPPTQPQPSKREVVLTPSADLVQQVNAEREQRQATLQAAAAAQPSTADPAFEHLYQTVPTANTGQAIALSETAARAQEANRHICMRVKSVLVIGIYLLVSSVYFMVASSTVRGGMFIFVISAIQAIMAATLLLSRDQNTVSLILKIFLILQIISTVLSLANPGALAISGVGVLLLGFAYMRVKSLGSY